MINLKPTISIVKKHLRNGSVASLTYAALECRLAIERICYERLRLAHDYISHADIRRWKPRDIIRIVMDEVDDKAASTFTMSVSADPPMSGLSSPTLKDYEAMEFHPIGTQIGFDPKKLGQLWHSLANVALHVSIPESKDDLVSQYGAFENIKAKVNEALGEIERIGQATLQATGFGEEISFSCQCGSTNKRRVHLLKNKQKFSCVNPDCDESFEYDKENERFLIRVFFVACKQCKIKHPIPLARVERLETNMKLTVNCRNCKTNTDLSWRLWSEEALGSEQET